MKCWKIFLILLAVTFVIALGIGLIASSLKKLESDEIGLQYDDYQKKLQDEPKQEGLHIGPVGYHFVIFPNVYKTIWFPSLSCLNKDGVPIDLNVAFQYRVKPSALHRIVIEFKDHDGYLEILKAVAESSIHQACSQFNTSQFPSERGALTEEIRTTLVARYVELDCEVADLQVNNFNRPEVYEQAVREKERSREDIQVAFNERPRKLTEAETAKRKSEFKANITLLNAWSDTIIFENQARAEAESILHQYEREAETYAGIITDLNFTTEGFLSYLGVRVISDAKNPVYVGIESPAKTSYIKP